MAFTSEGYNGAFTEVAAAHLSGLYLQPCVVGDSFAYSGAVPGEARTLRFTGGTCYGHSIRARETGTTDLQFGAVVSGVRYDTVAIRYDATSNTTSLVVVEGGTSQTVASDLEDSPGITVDDPIHLVRVDAGTPGTATWVADLREFHTHDGMRRFRTIVGRDLRVTDKQPGQRVHVAVLGMYEYGVDGSGDAGWIRTNDTGWMPLPLFPGISAHNVSATPGVRRSGNLVMLRGSFRKTNNAPLSGAVSLASVPLGYRPPVAPQRRLGTSETDATGSAFRLDVSNTGVISAYFHADVSWGSIDGISYFID